MSFVSFVLIFAKSQLSHANSFLFHSLFSKAQGHIMRKEKKSQLCSNNVSFLGGFLKKVMNSL